jgi:hypothetical protein
MSITLPVPDFVTEAEDAATAITEYVAAQSKAVPLSDLMGHLRCAHPNWDQLTLSRGLVRAMSEHKIAPVTPAADAFVVGAALDR